MHKTDDNGDSGMTAVELGGVSLPGVEAFNANLQALALASQETFGEPWDWDRVTLRVGWQGEVPMCKVSFESGKSVWVSFGDAMTGALLAYASDPRAEGATLH